MQNDSFYAVKKIFYYQLFTFKSLFHLNTAAVFTHPQDLNVLLVLFSVKTRSQ